MKDYLKYTKSVIHNIRKQYNDYLPSECVFHFNEPCFTLLNTFNVKRFHCLYINSANNWKSYSITKSCDIPEHFYDMIKLKEIFGNEYVLPFVGHFREYTGYTIGMFQQDIELYPPTKITRGQLKETIYTFILFLCATCYRLGGSTPNINKFQFVYTTHHPVLCNIGSENARYRERVSGYKEHFNKKKWLRFMTRKTIRDIIRYARITFPHYFLKKKQNRCILKDDENDKFDSESHALICQSEKKSLVQVLKEFQNLIPNTDIKKNTIDQWIAEKR